MSRSARKPKPDNVKRGTVKETTPTKLDLQTEESHPCGFTQAEWSNVLNQEDGDEAVGEIMDELLSKVMDKCYKAYMKQQCVPFSVSWAKSYITQTLEDQVLYTEEAEPVKAHVTEDSEPVPAIPDSWAQGCVPVVHATNQPQCSTFEEADGGCAPIGTEQSGKKQHDIVDLKVSPINQDEDETCTRNYDSYVLSPKTPPKTSNNKTLQMNKLSKNSPRKLRPSLSCSTGNNNVDIEGKNMEYSADKQKTAFLHQHNNHNPITKLDPLSLPRHWLSPQYEIVDDTKSNSKKPKSKKQQQTPKPLTSSKVQAESFQRRKEDAAYLSEHGK